MAMPQRDNNIEQIHRLEGLIAYADEQTNLDRIAALKEECLMKKDGDTQSKIGFAA